MRLIENIDPRSDDVTIASEHIYLPEVDHAAMLADVVDWNETEIDCSGIKGTSSWVVTSAIHQAHLSIEGAGLSSVMDVDQVIIKTHEHVARRDAAVAEQFFHADVAVNGFIGIWLIGVGAEPGMEIPETHMLNNAEAIAFVQDLSEGTSLEGRLGELVTVRPTWRPEDTTVWRSRYPDFVLGKLNQPGVRELLTDTQREHVDRALADGFDTTPYEGEVLVTPLVDTSVIDGSPVLSCGASSRELRLSLLGGTSEEERAELDRMHSEITRYLVGSSAAYFAEEVVPGSALFVARNQLHRATPYISGVHNRSVVAVRAVPKPGVEAPNTWQYEDGTIY